MERASHGNSMGLIGILGNDDLFGRRRVGAGLWRGWLGMIGGGRRS